MLVYSKSVSILLLWILNKEKVSIHYTVCAKEMNTSVNLLQTGQELQLIVTANLRMWK